MSGLFARVVAPRLPQFAPLAAGLDRRRLAALPEMLEARAEQIEQIRQALGRDHRGASARGPQSADADIDAQIRALIFELGERAAARGPLWRLAWGLDQRVHTTELEILDGDDTQVSPTRRAAAMRGLTQLNARSGAHATWTRVLLERLPNAAHVEPPPHLWELASGTGAFARALREGASRTGRSLRITATDLDLDVLRAPSHAERAWLDTRPCDATRLPPLDHVDMVVCVQAAHHFAPFDLLRMLRAATESAGHLVVIDVYRAAANVLVAGFGALVFGRDRIVLLDGMRSIRRGYTPAELALLAAIAAPHAEACTAGIAPAYALLELSRSPSR